MTRTMGISERDTRQSSYSWWWMTVLVCMLNIVFPITSQASESQTVKSDTKKLVCKPKVCQSQSTDEDKCFCYNACSITPPASLNCSGSDAPSGPGSQPTDPETNPSGPDSNPTSPDSNPSGPKGGGSLNQIPYPAP